ncbi:MAG: GTP-binding protein [Nitrospirota bacterium]
MRVTVVTGTLGAGKTTFIRNILEDSREEALVLVNDFGSAGLDGAVLAAQGLRSVELPSGCVCCTLRQELAGALTEALKEHAAEHLVIEPSGVASPGGVLAVLEELALERATVVGIADATDFAELYEADVYGPFFAEQVRASDVVLLNKTDLAAEEAIRKAEGLIEALNPGALLLRTVMARLPEHHAPLLARGAPGGPRARGRPPHGSHALPFETVSLRIAARVPRSWVEGLFEQLRRGTFGQVVRAKGLFLAREGPLRADLASRRVELAPFAGPLGEGRLVVIGAGLRKEALARAAQPPPQRSSGLPSAGD